MTVYKNNLSFNLILNLFVYAILFFFILIVIRQKKINIKFYIIPERDLRYSKWKMAVERSMKWDLQMSLDN